MGGRDERKVGEVSQISSRNTVEAEAGAGSMCRRFTSAVKPCQPWITGVRARRVE